MEGENFEQESFVVNDNGELEVNEPKKKKKVEKSSDKQASLPPNIQEGSSGVRRSRVETGKRSLFTPMELLDENMLKISQRAKNGERTQVQLCSKHGTTNRHIYELQEDILVVPVEEYRGRKVKKEELFFCCFVLSLDSGLELGHVYRDLWEDFLTEENPYVFVHVKPGNITSITEKKINGYSEKVRNNFEEVKENWGVNKNPLFGEKD